MELSMCLYPSTDNGSLCIFLFKFPLDLAYHILIEKPVMLNNRLVLCSVCVTERVLKVVNENNLILKTIFDVVFST